jgi:alpha-L-fucosidase
MDKNSESIYGTKAGLLPLQNWGVSTTKNNRLYLHIFNWPKDGKLIVGGLKSTPSSITFLAAKQTLTATRLNDKDLVIALPKTPIDTINTVIVLDFKNKIDVDTVRYVSTNIQVTRLLAFDATQHGKGFGFGDGKTDRYYVDGWKNNEQSLSFNFRTTTPSTFKVVIKYLADNNTGATYNLTLDKLNVEKQVIGQKQNKVTTEDIGQVKLEAGLHEVSIKPVDIKTELMKLLEVQLIPVK